MQIKAILTLLDEVKARLVVLFCHRSADPDALCSAYAFSQLLKRIAKVEVEVVAPQGLSKISKQVLARIPVQITSLPSIDGAEAIVLLDTNTLQQLGDWKNSVENSGKPIIIIDHHAVHPETRQTASLQIVDDNASSTCEVVFELFKQASLPPSKSEALALFLGMAYDTKHFILATSKTFKTAAELIDLGVKVEEALPLLELPLDLSERIARIKAATRLRLVRIEEWILTLSEISSHQASAARALVNLGSHIAIVGGRRGQELRISMRSSRQFYLKTKVHLGRDIAEPLGRYVQGMGGGHSTSAGVNGIGEATSALNECTRLLRERLLSSK